MRGAKCLQFNNTITDECALFSGMVNACFRIYCIMCFGRIPTWTLKLLFTHSSVCLRNSDVCVFFSHSLFLSPSLSRGCVCENSNTNNMRLSHTNCILSFWFWSHFLLILSTLYFCYFYSHCLIRTSFEATATRKKCDHIHEHTKLVDSKKNWKQKKYT